MVLADHLAVGVLSLQGGFKEHLNALGRQAGVLGVEVRTAADLTKIHALILPGGESTTIGKALVNAGMLDEVRAFCKAKPVWGVCAGLILLADQLATVEGGTGTQPLIGGMDAVVTRNYFGRQNKSRFRRMTLTADANGLGETAYFIRAPAITSVGAGLTVLASTAGGVAVAGRQGHLLATCFHPEISHDDSWLQASHMALPA
jgi:pyridoxal 5'-phosphate synthase glutaminase subunit Pdx2